MKRTHLPVCLGGKCVRATYTDKVKDKDKVKMKRNTDTYASTFAYYYFF